MASLLFWPPWVPTEGDRRRATSGYGITQETIGVPVVSSMEEEELGRLQDGLKVYFDRTARESDGVIVMNRV